MKTTGMRFNAPMVRALLAGCKTQTRRMMKPQPTRIGTTTILEYRGGLYQPEKLPANSNFFNHCPYGQPGDQIWVRETHALVFEVDIPSGRPVGPIGTAGSPARPDWRSRYVYRADGEMPNVQWHHVGDSQPVRWTPDNRMPRMASRIQLEIVSVRVERLNDCSEADALAEGVKGVPCDHVRYTCEEIGCCGPTATGMYAALWDQINGDGSWAANPWVWVIEFKRVPQPPYAKDKP